MTPLKKDEINRTIAEAMGWTGFTEKRTERDVILAHPPGEKTAYSSKFPLPADSISDALEAVDVLYGPWYTLTLISLDGGYYAVLGKTDILFIDNDDKAETRPAAVSLALVQYIKEK